MPSQFSCLFESLASLTCVVLVLQRHKGERSEDESKFACGFFSVTYLGISVCLSTPRSKEAISPYNSVKNVLMTSSSVSGFKPPTKIFEFLDAPLGSIRFPSLPVVTNFASYFHVFSRFAVDFQIIFNKGPGSNRSIFTYKIGRSNICENRKSRETIKKKENT